MAFMKQAPKRYFLELTGSMALYLAALYWRHGYAAAHDAPSALKTLVLLCPILPACLAALAIIRFYNRMDEMHRRVMLETIAVGAAFMAIAALGFGYGEDAGLPHLGIIWAWPLMGLGWGLAACYRGLNIAISEKGWGKALRDIARIIVPIIVLTGLYMLVAPHLGWPQEPPFIILVAAAVFLAEQAYHLFVKRVCE